MDETMAEKLRSIELRVLDVQEKITVLACSGIPEFVTLDEAARLKGGCSLNTYRTRRVLQPCAGTNSVKIGGRKCWRKEDVVEWLKVDDDGLNDYTQKFKERR